jgi:hypothetical protein
VIVTAGLAEVVAGAIAMGLGGYLAARTDAEHYAAEEQREHHEVGHLREREIEEVEHVLPRVRTRRRRAEVRRGAIASDR